MQQANKLINLDNSSSFMPSLNEVKQFLGNYKKRLLVLGLFFVFISYRTKNVKLQKISFNCGNREYYCGK